MDRLSTIEGINCLTGQVTKREDPLTRMYIDLIDEQEELIISCLAAGVPINLMRVTSPELRFNRETFSTYLVSDLYFTGRI